MAGAKPKRRRHSRRRSSSRRGRSKPGSRWPTTSGRPTPFANAERTLKSALAIDAQNAAAHRALALLYITTGRRPEAEPHFRSLAVDAAGRLALADYYMGVGRNAEAMTLLTELQQSAEKPDAREARLRIASIEYGAGRKAEAHRHRRRVDPGTSAIRRGADREGPHAAVRRRASGRSASRRPARRSRRIPYLAAAQYTLGLAAVADHKLDEAENAFEEAAALSPQAAAARMQLASVKLARGDAAGAVSIAELAANERPTDADAAVLLGQSLRARAIPIARRMK